MVFTIADWREIGDKVGNSIVFADVELAVQSRDHRVGAVDDPGVGDFRAHNALVGELTLVRLVGKEMCQILVASSDTPEEAVLAHGHGADLALARGLADVDKSVFFQI